MTFSLCNFPKLDISSSPPGFEMAMERSNYEEAIVNATARLECIFVFAGR